MATNGNNSNGFRPEKRLKNGCDPYEIGKATQIRPGEVRNPGGRPKKRLIDEVLTELLEAGESKESVAIAKKLIAKAKKGDGKIAQLVAERTQGKPRQSIDVGIEISGSIAMMTDEALASRAAELAEMVRDGRSKSA